MNNCAQCDHKLNPQGGHCYMFREEPPECQRFTERSFLSATSLPAMTALDLPRDVFTFDVIANALIAVGEVALDAATSSGEAVCKVGEVAGEAVCAVGEAAGEILSAALD